ncbi:MAG: hypothetical protein ACRC10_11925 [Thermoguttaceae bacterium]
MSTILEDTVLLGKSAEKFMHTLLRERQTTKVGQPNNNLKLFFLTQKCYFAEKVEFNGFKVKNDSPVDRYSL